MFKNLEETMHVHVRHLSQDSTFDLFQFVSKSFKTRGAAYLRVRLICQCLRHLIIKVNSLFVHLFVTIEPYCHNMMTFTYMYLQFLSLKKIKRSARQKVVSHTRTSLS